MGELPEAVLRLAFIGGLGVCAPGSSSSYMSPETVEKLFQEYLALHRKNKGEFFSMDSFDLGTLKEAWSEIEKAKAK